MKRERERREKKSEKVKLEFQVTVSLQYSLFLSALDTPMDQRHPRARQ
jgi:hypothetical protein